MADNYTFENLHLVDNINKISANDYPVDFMLHWHKYVEIAVFPENAKYTELPVITINQTSYTLNPGDVIFMWPGELHDIHYNSDHVLFGLQFMPDLFAELPDFTPYHNLFRTFHLIARENAPELSEILMLASMRILNIQEQAGSFHGIEALINLLEMFVEFGLYINRTMLATECTNSENFKPFFDKITQACNFIAENCTRPLRLDDVANYVGFSSCYFSRIFKEATGYGYVEYLNLQRIKKAQALLSDSSLTITEVSYQSGFKSISTFNRTFLQHEGCSPREYRKYYLND